MTFQEQVNAHADRWEQPHHRGDDGDAVDNHRNQPRPSPDCLYGLVGEVARAGSVDTEANEYAIAANALAYLSAAVGRVCYMPVGNTWHHPRLFTSHVGRSALGRKGDAANLIHRIDKALRLIDPSIAPQVHRGGLSTREGLALLIHDGYSEGKREVPAIDDKRLMVFESEFANVLAQSKRDGNTLSPALRDAWDGVSIRPATKTCRVYASDPHIALSVAVTPTELRTMLMARELTNGFANRFMFIWAERTKVLPFPKATPQDEVDRLAQCVAEVVRFTGGRDVHRRDEIKVELSPAARDRYGALYLGELNGRAAGERITGLLERRAPTLLRIAMLFALTDQTAVVDIHHIDAALAWIRYWSDSVRFIFSSENDEAASAELSELAERIVGFLAGGEKASRKQIVVDCLGGHKSKDKIDAALDELLQATPPRIVVESVARTNGPGTATKFYRLAANSANSANSEQPRGFATDLRGANSANSANRAHPDNSHISHGQQTTRRAQTRANADDLHSSHSSRPTVEYAAHPDGEAI